MHKNNRLHLHGSVSRAVLASALFCIGGAAHAQDAIETVVVTGIRASLQSALDAKRDASQVVDAIDAEGIGKFPDKNLGEALQRVTGVQITRSYGEGSQVSIRGGDPNMTRVEMNGTGVMSLTVGAGDRAVDLRDLPVEFVSRLEVVKSPTADMTEGGLGGTVNVVTRRPFDSKEPYIAGSVQGVYSNLAHAVDPMIAVIGSKLFFNDTLGVQLSVQWTQQHQYDNTANTTGWLRSTTSTYNGAPANANKNDFNNDGTLDWYPQIPRYIDYMHLTARKALSNVIEYRPTDTFKFYIDTNYASAKENDDIMYLQLGASDGVFDYTNTTVGDDNTVSRLVLTSNGSNYVSTSTCKTANTTAGCLPLDLTYRTILGDLHRATLTEAVGFQWDADPQFTMSGRVDYGFGKVTNNVITVSATAYGLDEAIVDYNNKYHAPNIQFPGLDTTSGDKVKLLDAEWSPETDTSRETAEKMDFHYKPAWANWLQFKTGFQHHEYKIEQYYALKHVELSCRGGTSSGYYLIYSTDCGTISNIVSSTATVNDIPFYSTGDLGFSGGTRYWNAMTLATAEKVMSTAQTLGATDYDPFDLTTTNPNSGYAGSWRSMLDNWSVKEATSSVYSEAFFDFPDFYVPISGNIGLRYVNTNTRSDGYTKHTSGTTVTYPTETITGGYNQMLPSGNLKIDIIPDTLVGRLAFGKVMSRPAPTNIAIKRSLDIVGYTGSEGNPNLKPFTSTDYDLGLEYYFGGVNFASMTLFQKKIVNFIQNTTTTEQIDDGSGNVRSYAITKPMNYKNPVTINGVEMGLQYGLDWLPSPFNGAGLTANLTLQQDHGYNVKNSIDGSALTFQGLSRTSYNLSGYYENEDISVRLSYNWRAHWLSAASGRGGLPEFFKSYGQMDASFSYNVTENLAFFVEGTNLLDAQMIAYNAPVRPIQLETFGSKVYFGIRAKY